MKNGLAVFLIVAVTLNIKSQQVDFFREDLKFRLDNHYFEVTGDYYFRNASNSCASLMLIYPFPSDTAVFGKVDSVKCVDLSDGHSHMDTVNAEYMLFSITIAANESKVYQISYRQQLLGNKALYILTSTQRWAKPFEEVSYKLITENVFVDSISYIPDRVEVFPDSTTYYWKKKYFMPDRNFEISFSLPGIE